MNCPGREAKAESRRGDAVKLLGAVEVGVRELPDAVNVGGVGQNGEPLDWRREIRGGLQNIVLAGNTGQIEIEIRAGTEVGGQGQRRRLGGLGFQRIKRGHFV